MLYNDTQTIAAISTAVTESGIGIVRISGEQAIEIADRIYIGKNGKKLSGPEDAYDPLWLYRRW